jgi:CRISPR-associated protein Cmr5
MKSVNQQLLAHAYQKVKARDSEPEEAKKKYGIWCHNLPGLISVSGLAQAIAFMESKMESKKGKDDGFKFLLEDLKGIPGVAVGELKDVVIHADVAQYMFYTQRIQQALVFFKRFAVSILKVESGDQDTEQ